MFNYKLKKENRNGHERLDWNPGWLFISTEAYGKTAIIFNKAGGYLLTSGPDFFYA